GGERWGAAGGGRGAARKSGEGPRQQLAFDMPRRSKPAEQLASLLRAAQSLAPLGALDELLRVSLDKAVRALKAQCGAILLADPSGRLSCRATFPAERLPTGQPPYSHTLALRRYRRAESGLCNA